MLIVDKNFDGHQMVWARMGGWSRSRHDVDSGEESERWELGVSGGDKAGRSLRTKTKVTAKARDTRSVRREDECRDEKDG